ncbi:hypothetical protein [Mesorhizobium sp. M0491]|uniref:hypothetical protein n=1 Tax=Mesorhizobium sp. M0491 TaxID=2956950 RepID=UPI003339CA1A
MFKSFFTNVRQFSIRIFDETKSDWRAQGIVALTIIAVVGTLVVYAFWPAATDPAKFAGAVFAGWMAGLLLSILGLITAVVSLSNPERDAFNSRARILLRGRSGSHIDFLIDDMNTLLEPYVVSATKKMTINDYDEATNRFHIIYHSMTELRAYLDDIPTKFEPKVGYEHAAQSPQNRPQAGLTFIRIDGLVKVGPTPFDTKFLEGPFPVVISPGQSCVIEHRFNCWVAANDPNRFSAMRFVQNVEMEVRNDLPERNLLVDPQAGGLPSGPVTIPPGEAKMIVNLKDLKPAKHVYDFRVTAA